MLNKPINPQPYFNSIDAQDDFILSCHIPNANITGFTVNVYDAQNDKLIYSNSQECAQSDTIEFLIDNSVFNKDDSDKIENGKDYYWNVAYFDIPVNTSSSSTVIDKESIQLARHIEAGDSYVKLQNVGPSTDPFVTGENNTARTESAEVNNFNYWDDAGLIWKGGEFEKWYEGIKNKPEEYVAEIGGYFYGIKRVEEYGDEKYKLTYASVISRYTVGNESIHNSNTVLRIYKLSRLVLSKGDFIKAGRNAWMLVSDVKLSTSGTTPCYEASIVGSFTYKVDYTPTTTPVWYARNVQYNKSPDYYFMARKSPSFKVVSDQEVDVYGSILMPHGVFWAEYDNDDGDINLNYIYYNVWQEYPSPFGSQKKLIYQSPKYTDIKYVVDDQTNKCLNTPLVYRGFAHGNHYSVECIGIDKDDNPIISEAIEFDSNYSYEPIDVGESIKCDKTSIRINTDEIISKLKERYFDEFGQNLIAGNMYVYRCKEGIINSECEFVGSCLIRNNKPEVAVFDDFIVSNHSSYTYLFALCVGSPSQPFCIFNTSQPVHTVFDGAYIASVCTNTPPADDVSLGHVQAGSRGEYIINTCDDWLFTLKYDSTLPSITYNLSRERVDGVGKYFKILRGEQEAISAQETYLLGDVNARSDYVESSALQNKWRNFVQNNNLKFYRPYVGEPMIIDIESFDLQPAVYLSQIVNELKFNYVQVGCCDKILMQRYEES